MKVLVVGASGFLGGRLAAALQGAGHEVLRAGRHGPLRADLADPATDWPRLLAGVQAVVNAAGVFREPRGQRFDDVHAAGPKRLFEACVAAGVRRVVQVSTLGPAGGPAGWPANGRVNEPADGEGIGPGSGPRPDLQLPLPPFLRSKVEADRHLLSLPLDGTVVRPSLVFGPEGASA